MILEAPQRPIPLQRHEIDVVPSVVTAGIVPVKTASTIDAELRAAVDAFHRASGYRFAVGDAGLQVEGGYQRGKPLHLVTRGIEAYRTAERVVYKTTRQTAWSVLTPPLLQGVASHLAGEIERGRATPRGKAGASDPRGLLLIANLPAPHELLDHLDSRVRSCTRGARGDGTSADTTTFDCQLEPDVGRPDCTLQITLNQGKVEQITLVRRRAPGPAGAEAANAVILVSDPSPAACRYRVTDIDRPEVTVPSDALRMLGQR